MKPRRPVLWVTDSVGFGGSEVNLLRVLRFTAQCPGAVVHAPAVAAEVVNGIRAIGLPMQVMKFGNAATDVRRALTSALRLICSNFGSPMVIWSHTTDSARWLQVALAVCGKPYAVVEQFVPSDRRDFATSRLSIPLKRWNAGRAKCVVLNAHSQAGHYRRLFGIAGRNIRIIVNSRPVSAIVDRVNFLRTDFRVIRAQLGLPTSGKVIVCVARLADQKDQATLIRAWPSVGRTLPHRPTLALIGDGPDRPMLERLAANLVPGQVFFAGYQSDPLPWLAAADAFVLPSISEGLPGALIEAMAAGLPCIATDIPGNRELVIDGVTGLTVPVQSPDRLAAAIDRLLNEPDTARRLAAAGQKHVAEHYDEAAEATAWNDLLDELHAA